MYSQSDIPRKNNSVLSFTHPELHLCLRTLLTTDKSLRYIYNQTYIPGKNNSVLSFTHPELHLCLRK